MVVSRPGTDSPTHTTYKQPRRPHRAGATRLSPQLDMEKLPARILQGASLLSETQSSAFKGKASPVADDGQYDDDANDHRLEIRRDIQQGQPIVEDTNDEQTYERTEHRPHTAREAGPTDDYRRDHTQQV